MSRRALVAMIAAAVLLSLPALARAQTRTKKTTEQKTGAADRGVSRSAPELETPVGLRVTLSVYSGRPNPSWTVEPGPELDRLVGLVKELKPAAAKLFDYDEWNRLGYASFRLSARGVPGVPAQVHVWRDMAVVVSKEEKGAQATGSANLYETLVRQAEARGYAEFFVNYRKEHPAKK